MGAKNKTHVAAAMVAVALKNNKTKINGHASGCKKGRTINLSMVAVALCCPPLKKTHNQPGGGVGVAMHDTQCGQQLAAAAWHCYHSSTAIKDAYNTNSGSAATTNKISSVATASSNNSMMSTALTA